MSRMRLTLLAIAIFLALAVGSFIYFVTNWDRNAPTSFGAVPDSAMHAASLFSVPEKSRGPGHPPAPALSPSEASS